MFSDKFVLILTVYRRLYVEKKCQLGATEVFIADLIACSICFGHFMVTPCINNIQHSIYQLFEFFIYIFHIYRFSRVTICSHNTDNVLYNL